MRTLTHCALRRATDPVLMPRVGLNLEEIKHGSAGSVQSASPLLALAPSALETWFLHRFGSSASSIESATFGKSGVYKLEYFTPTST